ncbi:Tat binding protein 1-interacting protein-domain-containing protein [Ephemerocybe angulata]|uniref:Tat binding protein 1-interacting protein-domain-containing protein n=1 Tax=Ephemerocybe angulata TaxID=980116 RepID=A0A8H6MDM7_9AGAR|nr:Tat binding protein 1-interacting protein-domain-containing protein [Tulosesus angulatus]
MASKPKVPVLKGQEAEDKVLEYLKAMNRPYGAVDVAANLKGAVQKTLVQKILVALAEKGELVQKTYGKTTFFVVNQANLEIVPAEKLASLESELKAAEEENTALSADVKGLSSELAKVRSTPTDGELSLQIGGLEEEIAQIGSRLQPLRTGAPPISPDDLEKLQCDWEKWKTEWFRRRKVFFSLWGLATDALAPQESEELEEVLGIERDTPEHEALERGPFCAPKSLKRKRL